MEFNTKQGPISVNDPSWPHEAVKHHGVTGDQVRSMDELRNHAEAFLQAVIRESPNCADRAAALRKIREGLWSANAAIASGGTV